MTLMELPPWVIFLAGLVIIVLGAELLLRGASRIALLLGIPPIVIGLTIVSVGTSAPELAVGLAAATQGKGALAVGNIAGTNMLNILFILGLSALIRPLPVRLLSIRLDVPVMIASAAVLVAMSADRVITRVEGLVLVGAAVPYTIALIYLSRRESASERRDFAEEYRPELVVSPPGAQLPGRRGPAMAWNAVLLGVGIALAVLGAELLVSGAIDIATALGVSDAVIGLTIVAIGTSAPELATTLVATWKNDRDVAVGNLVGSSIYNVLVILGITCAASPGGAELTAGILLVDLPLAALVAIVCLPVFRSGRMVSRREGGAFVLAYLLYLGSLLVWRS